MIKSFRHKGLRRLWNDDDPRDVPSELVTRIKRRLSVLNAASNLRDFDLPGLHFHPLRGTPERCAIAVNGPWRITFAWEAGDAFRVDLEQYH